eukprot:1158535-Pelagomonas_calceolata.AAC.1
MCPHAAAGDDNDNSAHTAFPGGASPVVPSALQTRALLLWAYCQWRPAALAAAASAACASAGT